MGAGEKLKATSYTLIERFISVRLHASEEEVPSGQDLRVLHLYAEFRPEVVGIPGYGKIRIGLIEALVAIDLYGLRTDEILFPPLRNLFERGPLAQITETHRGAPARLAAKVDFQGAAAALATGIPSEIPFEVSLTTPSRGAESVSYTDHLIHTDVSRKVSITGRAIELAFVTRRRNVSPHDVYLSGACTIPITMQHSGGEARLSVFSSKISNHAFAIVGDHLAARAPGRMNPFRVLFKRAVEKRLSQFGPLVHIDWDFEHA